MEYRSKTYIANVLLFLAIITISTASVVLCLDPPFLSLEQMAAGSSVVASNFTARIEKTDGDSEKDEMHVDCNSTQAFPYEIFGKQSDLNVVYLNYEMFDENTIFARLGFNRYLRVFGIPIVTTPAVSDASLFHLANVLAAFIDNDSDGFIDRPSVMESIYAYNVIIGFVSGSQESDMLWTNKFSNPVNAEFANQFACNMHFFEQWDADAQPDFYPAHATQLSSRKKNAPLICDIDSTKFDWPLWYFPFALTYYGYLEDFSEAEIDLLKMSMQKARSEGIFIGTYPNDEEMELADFFVWTLLTKLGAIECHCHQSVISDVWKICTPEDLQSFDNRWFQALETIESIPKVLPTGKYLSSTSNDESGLSESSKNRYYD